MQSTGVRLASSIRSLGDKIIGSTLPFFAALIWPIPFLHRILIGKTSKKRVLLVARNAVAADHLVCISNNLDQDNRIRQSITTDRIGGANFKLAQASRIVPVPPVHILSALLQHWDLIIFTNHPYGLGVCFSPFLKKVYINHGIHTGKINNNIGQDGVYGRSKVLRPFGRPYYDLMFAASDAEKEFASKVTPEIADRVRVTGFLKADLFVEYAINERDGLRESLGFTNTDRVVHIISTWGEGSLYNVCGKRLFEQIGHQSKEYKFMLSVHPRFDELGETGQESRNSLLGEFERIGVIVNRDLDWERYVSVADAAISDHSSLCLYHLILEHPLVFIDVAEDQYMKGSTFDRLKKNSALLSNFNDLEEALHYLFGSERTHGCTQVSDQILTYKGHAAIRYSEEFAGLLLDE